MHAIDWALALPSCGATVDAGKNWKRRSSCTARQREDLGYLAGEREIDLVVNRDRPEQLINVAYSVTAPRTWVREITALEQGAARFRARRGCSSRMNTRPESRRPASR